MAKSLSIVIPVHNEERNIVPVFEAVREVCATLPYAWHVLFVDDGSRDGSLKAIRTLAEQEPAVKFLELSRNFGKEVATSAGLAHADADGVILMDADLQHPPALIATFVQHWEEGADVVIGVRVQNQGEGMVKRVGSRVFYRIMDAISDTELQSGETDFRLIDRRVVEVFNGLKERNRMTRTLLNWLGFRRVNVLFTANARQHGEAAYSPLKLARLAVHAFVANSLFPLKIAGYLGVFIMILAGFATVFIGYNKYFTNDPFGFNFSGLALLAFFNLFFVGIILACLGLVALYVGNIHAEVAGRPVFVVRSKRL